MPKSNSPSKLAESIDDGAMDVSTPVETAATKSKNKKKVVTVDKPTPYSFDLGNLLAIDPNPVPADADETAITAIARDAAQVLINQLLTTCDIKSTSDGVTLNLPAPSTPIPREKPVPEAKPPTTWEKFAAKKGIKDKKRGEGKMVYDEATGEWVPKWGYKGKNKDGDDQWLVEVDEKKEMETGIAHNARADGRRERKEKVRRNERKQRANERKAGKGGR